MHPSFGAMQRVQGESDRTQGHGSQTVRNHYFDERESVMSLHGVLDSSRIFQATRMTESLRWEARSSQSKLMRILLMSFSSGSACISIRRRCSDKNCLHSVGRTTCA